MPQQESNPRPLKVFICHCSEDSEKATELYDKLSVQAWIDPWLDKKKILAGQNWDAEIRKAVSNADVVLVCNSKVLSTKRGYVQKEVKLALDTANEQPEGTIYVIPLRLDNAPLLDSLTKWHWVEYQKDDGFERLLSSLKHKATELGLEITLSGASPAPTVIQPQAGRLPGLTEEDEVFFKLICDNELINNEEVILPHSYFEAAESAGIDEEEVSVSIDALRNAGYIRDLKRSADGFVFSFKIAFYGFEKYAQKYVADFQALDKKVAIEIDAGAKAASELAEKLGQPIPLITHILTSLQARNLIKVYPLQDEVIITEVLPLLKRFIKS